MDTGEITLTLERADIAMATAGQLAREKILRNGLNIAHEAFADYLLVNPGCTLVELAAVFGYTPSWVCTVINSDMFKAYLSERRKGIEVAIANDLPSKLAAAAHLATEKIITVLTKTEDPDTVIDAFDKILARHGYAPKQGVTVNNQQNNFFLSPADLAQSRETLVNAHQAPAQIEGEKVALPAPAE